MELALLNLRKGDWVSDNVIRAYLKLVASKAKQHYGVVTEILAGQYYDAVKTKGHSEATKHWKTRKDVVEADFVMWYLNPGHHWTLMVISPKRKVMRYFDSLLPQMCVYFEESVIRDFCDAEAKLLGYPPFNWEEWSFVVEKNIPKQSNGSDCGVFLMKYAYCILMNEPMMFCQDTMNTTRLAIATEIENFTLYRCNTQLMQNRTSSTDDTTNESTLFMSKSRIKSDGNDASVTISVEELDCSLSPSDAFCLPLQEISIPSLENTDMPTIPTLSCHSSTLGTYQSAGQSDVESFSDKENNIDQSTPTESATKNPTVHCWETLDPALQAVLPNERSTTYVVTEFTALPTLTFSGAPACAFEATIRINLKTKDDAQEWLQNMMQHSKCTYRHTRGRAAGLKRVLHKVDMHCQHQKKQMTPKQQHKAALAHAKPIRKSLLHNTRNKKCECPSFLKLTVTVPPKHSNPRKKSFEPILSSHPTILKITYNHNHPIESAHVLSFRPISNETKQQIFDYFQKGHSASSAYHWHETKLFLDSGEEQSALVDRDKNPIKSDFSRLYEEWRKSEFGCDNGKSMFNHLQTEIEAYNAAMGSKGGHAILQRFKGKAEQSDSEDASDSNSDQESPKRKRRKLKQTERETPMVVAVCTPLMSRVHQFTQQAGEMMFCDSTSTLDRFNTSLFVLSTSHACGGLPLGAFIVSDEQEETIVQGLKLLQRALPEEAFYKRGVKKGPSIVMTDDCSAERNALRDVWPESRLLLCVFHFLQSKWTWLHNGANRIANEDRQVLMNKTKMLVYANSEPTLELLYKQFKENETVKKYPEYMKYIESQWSSRRDWAVCYRSHLLTRGNQTNNYAEAGMRIVKDLVFNRVKAYNIVQMFSFITECFELYYTRKLLSFAHNRVDRYISLKYQGMKCAGISLEQIQQLANENTFLVNSQTERGVKYLVDMNLGLCSCIGGQDGSPCSHQAAVAKLFGVYSVNCISTISSKARQQLAIIALGDKAVQENDYYASLHQDEEEKIGGTDSNTRDDGAEGLQLLTAITSLDDQVAAAEDDCEEANNDDLSEVRINKKEVDDIVQQIQEFTQDITNRVNETPLVANAMKTFLRRYKTLTEPGTFVNARLSSALHRFGWVFGGTVSRKDHNGHFRRGRRIPVNAKAAGRRKGSASRGKAMALQGRPKGMKIATFPKSTVNLQTIHKLPKRPHSLSQNIARGVQNGGK